MKKLPTSQEASSRGTLEIANPSEACRKSAVAPSHDAQAILKNPVILALRRSADSLPETDRHAGERLRIANEILQQFGWLNGRASKSSDGIAVWAFRERCSKEQVNRTRAELEAYLHRSGGDEASGAHHPRLETRRPRDAHLRNPVLAALAGRHR